MKEGHRSLVSLPVLTCMVGHATAVDDALLQVSNGKVTIGMDRTKGGAITLLSWAGHPQNAVNLADPGRHIQQSYFAGKSLDRTAEGQHPAWSPWSWNPIQGGGVGSWARVTEFERSKSNTLYSVTTGPKLWDMPDEEAQALMRQGRWAAGGGARRWDRWWIDRRPDHGGW